MPRFGEGSVVGKAFPTRRAAQVAAVGVGSFLAGAGVGRAKRDWKRNPMVRQVDRGSMLSEPRPKSERLFGGDRKRLERAAREAAGVKRLTPKMIDELREANPWFYEELD